LKTVLDNQINYGFGHGKTLQWLNARGFLMFTKFLEGIQRVIRHTTLDNPVSSALAFLAGGWAYNDSPLADNMFNIDYERRFNNPYELGETLLSLPPALQIATMYSR